MNPFKYISLFILLTGMAFKAASQEFNCQVQVLATQLSGSTNQNKFATMQKQVYDFMNNYRFTNDKYEQNERIDCEILINVTTDNGDGTYSATIEIDSRRPIFKAGIYSPLFNYEDKQFSFAYTENQPFSFNLQGYTDEITAMLGYYAYVMLALDYDSFSLLGGTDYWKKAQQVVNNSQSGGQNGWNSSDNNFKNRYVYIDNFINQMFQPLRESIYNYHRKGMDQMYDNIDKARAEITKAIQNINEVQKNKPGSMNTQLFFEAKNQEIVNIYQGAPIEEKNNIIQILGVVDAANTTIYSRITNPQ